MARKKRIEERYRIALKSCAALNKALETFSLEEKDLDPTHTTMYYDSIIKRFELVYETFWKYLKEYIYEKHGIEAISPRTVFQECLLRKISSTEETKILTSMVESRNLTTHLYNESMAQTTAGRIPIYFGLVEKILKRTSPN